jgi:hypothetical protein
LIRVQASVRPSGSAVEISMRPSSRRTIASTLARHGLRGGEAPSSGWDAIDPAAAFDLLGLDGEPEPLLEGAGNGASDCVRLPASRRHDLAHGRALGPLEHGDQQRLLGSLPRPIGALLATADRAAPSVPATAACGASGPVCVSSASTPSAASVATSVTARPSPGLCQIVLAGSASTSATRPLAMRPATTFLAAAPLSLSGSGRIGSCAAFR